MTRGLFVGDWESRGFFNKTHVISDQRSNEIKPFVTTTITLVVALAFSASLQQEQHDVRAGRESTGRGVETSRGARERSGEQTRGRNKGDHHRNRPQVRGAQGRQ